MKYQETIHDGLELSSADGIGVWLLEVRIAGDLVGRIRRHPLSGTYRYYSARANEGAPLHEGNDLGSLLKWVAHRP